MKYSIERVFYFLLVLLIAVGCGQQPTPQSTCTDGSCGLNIAGKLAVNAKVNLYYPGSEQYDLKQYVDYQKEGLLQFSYGEANDRAGTIPCKDKSGIELVNVFINDNLGNLEIQEIPGAPSSGGSCEFNFQVSADNGDSISSSVMIHVRTPGAVTNLVSVPGDRQLRLSWIAPLNDGGSDIAYYVVRYKKVSAQNYLPADYVIAKVPSATITGLVNGEKYNIIVRAVNSIARGPFAAAPISTPAAAPGAPTALIPTAGNGQVSLKWTAPASNGGSAITDYVVEYKKSSDTAFAVFTDGVSIAASATVTGLTNGQAYIFRVKAKNAIGLSAYTADSAQIIPVTVPGAPTAIAGTVGNGQVILNWTAPASNGGSAITDYVIEYRPSNQASFWVFNHSPSTAASATVTGLTNGQAYIFRVKAKTAAGLSAYSADSAQITPVVPAVP
jgi:hypothetical protein